MFKHSKFSHEYSPLLDSRTCFLFCQDEKTEGNDSREPTPDHSMIATTVLICNGTGQKTQPGSNWFAVKGMTTTRVVYLSICGRSAIYRKIGFADISQL